MEKDEKDNRRLVAVPISSLFILDMVREGFTHEHGFKCIKGVPKDAVMIRDYFDDYTGRGMIVFYHPSFEVVPLGLTIPILNVIFERIIPEDNNKCDITDCNEPVHSMLCRKHHDEEII